LGEEIPEEIWSDMWKIHKKYKAVTQTERVLLEEPD